MKNIWLYTILTHMVFIWCRKTLSLGYYLAIYQLFSMISTLHSWQFQGLDLMKWISDILKTLQYYWNMKRMYFFQHGTLIRAFMREILKKKTICVFCNPKVWQIYILDSFSWNFLSSTIPKIVRSNQLNRKSIYL